MLKPKQLREQIGIILKRIDDEEKLRKIFHYAFYIWTGGKKDDGNTEEGV